MIKQAHKHFNSDKKHKVIYSRALCLYLFSQGFDLVEEVPHRLDAEVSIYVFENTNNLHYAIDRYVNNRERGY